MGWHRKFTSAEIDAQLRAIAGMLLEGHTRPEMAEKLGLSTRTLARRLKQVKEREAAELQKHITEKVAIVERRLYHIYQKAMRIANDLGGSKPASAREKINALRLARETIADYRQLLGMDVPERKELALVTMSMDDYKRMSQEQLTGEIKEIEGRLALLENKGEREIEHVIDDRGSGETCLPQESPGSEKV